eukprot:m.199087 g.199087  ORF g.199087 m.199087 type:complete len:496 (+) comp32721_c0_seq3:353-1840(+)
MATPQLTPDEAAVYKELWDQEQTDGTLDTSPAVTLLKLSNLETTVLRKIWDIADPETEGYLTEEGFYVALRMVSLGQQGMDINISNLNETTKLVDLQHKTADLKHLLGSADIITSEERTRYNQQFSKCGPVDGVMPGKKARKILTQSGLDIDLLGEIWELADIDADGALSEHEFAVAMHLVKNTLSGIAPPKVLSAAILEGYVPIGVAETVENVVAPIPTPVADEDAWIVGDAYLERFNEFFAQADKDGDGLVSGGDIMKVFLSSHLSKEDLAHVWNLVDINDTGFINNEQFALAMHFIAQKVKGTDLPKFLLPQHVPPSLRKTKAPEERSKPPLVPPKTHSQPEEPSPTLPPAVKPSKANVSQNGSGADEVKTQLAVNAALQQEVDEMENELKNENSQLTELQREIKVLRLEEKKMRQRLKEGKTELVKLLAEKRKAKNDKGRIEGKLSSLATSQRKIDQGLEIQRMKNTQQSLQTQEESVDTFGMSMSDYFGN